ncbi:MAG: GntR family transcriptional regulator [Gemmataceae bacterium]|nr:GntR family transcriptional regulator [Gemmataceae bacterium]
MTVAHPSSVLNCERGGRRQAIVESLLADVFQGRLRAGQHLVTQELADRFGVSHTPIREALISLAAVGIIDLAPNRGAVVRRVTAQDVRELCQVRRALECEATRQACGRIDLAELHSLADAIRRLQSVAPASAAKFIAEARAVDSRLHDLIAQSCGNKFLALELSRLKILFRGFRDVSYLRHEERNDLRRLAEEAHEHLAIVEGLLAGDGRAAAKAMARHIRSGLKYWTRSLPETIEPATNGNHRPQRNNEPRMKHGSNTD